jgi:hypothetical protein
VQFVDLGAQEARYVRLTVNSTWAAANLTQYANKLKIDEMHVGFGYPRGGAAQPPAEGGAGCPAAPGGTGA